MSGGSCRLGQRNHAGDGPRGHADGGAAARATSSRGSAEGLSDHVVPFRRDLRPILNASSRTRASGWSSHSSALNRVQSAAPPAATARFTYQRSSARRAAAMAGAAPVRAASTGRGWRAAWRGLPLPPVRRAMARRRAPQSMVAKSTGSFHSSHASVSTPGRRDPTAREQHWCRAAPPPAAPRGRQTPLIHERGGSLIHVGSAPQAHLHDAVGLGHVGAAPRAAQQRAASRCSAKP